MGSSCGANFVNAGSGGVTDGVTIVEGHEYAETVTDQFPAGGWTDLTGYENGDKCAWISSGQGAAQDITLSTGSYPVQSTWANDFNTGKGWVRGQPPDRELTVSRQYSCAGPAQLSGPGEGTVRRFGAVQLPGLSGGRPERE
jgi:serine protease